MAATNIYRSHGCGTLTKIQVGQDVRCAGWIHRKRDHGGVLFVEVRDHSGVVQCVLHEADSAYPVAQAVRVESVVTLTGKVLARDPELINPKLATGEIEIAVTSMTVLSQAEVLPFLVASQGDKDQEVPEELRLRYRFLDLRRERIHNNIVLRSRVISSIRRRMTEQGFLEIQTPILTSSSPEGARDYLVPSRLHRGKFYALPQAPQQFKQLLMVAGFDRYFQIAPCFRDEDARADRSPGEFYQLDLEMSFATQDDVFAALEPVLSGVFEEFGDGQSVTKPPFPRIPYAETMLRYGSDKPDLRNPLVIQDVTELFRDSQFGAFANAIKTGAVVRAIYAPGAASQPRSWFDRLAPWVQSIGGAGLAYVNVAAEGLKGGISKFVDDARLRAAVGAENGGSVFFVCDRPECDKVAKLAGAVRTRLGEDLNLIEKTGFKFCWIVDFPMYEFNEETQKIEFSHNPFSMPQGELEALNTQDPLTIKAYQYDIVCNGVELSSGAIRNHRPEVMYRAFEIAGYTRADVETKFGGLLNAFKFGAPPHGGSAPGIDRIVMLLAGEPNIREVVAFPMNQNAQDLLMGAPSPVTEKQLRELHIRIVEPPKTEKKDN
jgi:aspartyl-tRNA synthetase